MPTTPYFILSDSMALRTKRFRVPLGNYRPVRDKASSMKRAIGGNNRDVCMGGIYEDHEYVVRVRETDTDSNYGTLADLEYFYGLVDPQPTSGSPSCLLTFTDHFGVSNLAFLLGRQEKNPVTTILEGTEAWYMIPVVISVTTGS